MGGYYQLEDRTLRFARDVKTYVRTLHVQMEKDEFGRQLLRSSSSVGANYIEANEGLTKREKVYRIGISRKESKESWFFLRLLEDSGGNRIQRKRLEQEATELMNIFGAILIKLRN